MLNLSPQDSDFRFIKVLSKRTLGMVTRIELRPSEQARLHEGLWQLSRGNGDPVHPERVPDIHQRAKDLSDQLWIPGDEKRIGTDTVICDNFDLWVVFNGAITAEPPLSQVAEEAAEEYAERQYTQTSDPLRNREPWSENREKAIERDKQQCQECGMSRGEHREQYGEDLNVHHIKPLKEFDDAEKAHSLDNLKTVCKSCHATIEPRFQ
jgi:hypothetical protein